MRLDTERQKKLEPKRIGFAVKEIRKLGLPIIHECDRMIKFMYKEAIITFFPYSGWACGKTINDGRGIAKLLKQLV